MVLSKKNHRWIDRLECEPNLVTGFQDKNCSEFNKISRPKWNTIQGLRRKKHTLIETVFSTERKIVTQLFSVLFCAFLFVLLNWSNKKSNSPVGYFCCALAVIDIYVHESAFKWIELMVIFLKKSLTSVIFSDKTEWNVGSEMKRTF